MIVGHIREMKSGQVIDERDADEDNADGTVTYDIGAPQSSGSVDIVKTLLG